MLAAKVMEKPILNISKMKIRKPSGKKPIPNAVRIGMRFSYICTRYLFSFLQVRTMSVMIFISGVMIVEKLLLMEYLRWRIEDLPFHQKTHHMNDTMNMQQI